MLFSLRSVYQSQLDWKWMKMNENDSTFDVFNGILTPVNIHFDTRITFLSLWLTEIWQSEIFESILVVFPSSYLGCHLWFSKHHWSWLNFWCCFMKSLPPKHTIWHKKHLSISNINRDMAVWNILGHYGGHLGFSKNAT